MTHGLKQARVGTTGSYRRKDFALSGEDNRFSGPQIRGDDGQRSATSLQTDAPGGLGGERSPSVRYPRIPARLAPGGYVLHFHARRRYAPDLWRGTLRHNRRRQWLQHSLRRSSGWESFPAPGRESLQHAQCRARIHRPGQVRCRAVRHSQASGALPRCPSAGRGKPPPLLQSLSFRGASFSPLRIPLPYKTDTKEFSSRIIMKTLFIFQLQTLLLLLPGRLAYAQPAGSAEIELNLQKLNTVGSVLMIAAHPDDENTNLLAYYARRPAHPNGLPLPDARRRRSKPYRLRTGKLFGRYPDPGVAGGAAD